MLDKGLKKPCRFPDVLYWEALTMSFQEDLNTLHNFLLQTSEGNLKRMLIDGKMTDVHLRLLIKIAKNAGHEEFHAAMKARVFLVSK